MGGQPVFEIEEDAVHRVLCLDPEKHSAPLHALYETCADFLLLVDGHPAQPDAAKQTFIETPPGRSLRDKFLYGIFETSGTLIGVLEGMRHYPEENIWWIGLLLLAPRARGSGLGRRLIRSFAEYARSQQCTQIMLGVVEENTAAYRFWQGLGFALVRQTEPRTMGEKTHVVNVMRLSLEAVRLPKSTII